MTGPKQNLRIAIFWFLLVVVFPMAIFATLEAILRFADIGPNLDLFEPYPGRPELLLTNPDVAQRYFPAHDMPGFSSSAAISSIKSDSTLRIFALGGSTTAGFPYNYNGSFPARLKAQLNRAYPGAQIEMMNLGLTAVNSFTVLDFVREVLDYEPDLLVLYFGHNEFYGAFGSASTMGIGSSLAGTRLYLALIRLRLFNLLRQLVLGRHGPDSGVMHGQTRMARMVGDGAIPFGSDSYNKTIANFGSNLEEILALAEAENVPVVLGTLVSNLSDQPPFISCSDGGHSLDFIRELENGREQLAAGQYDTAIGSALSAIKIEENHAEVWYLLGQGLAAEGNYTDASEAFERAKDLDCLRFRASSEINTIIRASANSNTVFLADVELAMKSASDNGLIGQNFMLEHLHPNHVGASLIAQTFRDVIIEHRLFGDRGLSSLVGEPVDILTGITPLDEHIADYQMEILLSDWPFTSGGAAVTVGDIKPLTFMDSVAVQVLAGRINYLDGHRAMTEWYNMTGDLASMRFEYRAMIQALPHEPGLYREYSQVLISEGYFDEALAILIDYYSRWPDIYGSKWIGTIDLQLGKTEEAVHYLELAKRLQPNDLQVRYNLSGAYYGLGNNSKALEEIEFVLGIEPKYPQAAEFHAGLSQSMQKSMNNYKK
ncbi:GDSL-type esterase/lipase family protein [Candidatus Neomarinimicrobiota bacterium]